MSETAKFFRINNDLSELTDEELIEMAKNKNLDALNNIFNRYRELVYVKASKFFIVGAEKDDLYQEGMIGLYKAILNYNDNKSNTFRTFANMCVERQLITAIKSSNRQKHRPLNSSLSLNSTSGEEDENEKTLLEVLNNNMAEDPLDTITKMEYYSNVENAIDKSLSNFEKQVLQKFANGDSYVKIAEELESPVKSVDNAIQRIRKKASKNIHN